MKLKKTSLKADEFQEYTILHKGEDLGRMKQHTHCVDTKPVGQRFVTRRREVKKWSLQLRGQEIVWGKTKKECECLIGISIYSRSYVDFVK